MFKTIGEKEENAGHFDGEEERLTGKLYICPAAPSLT